MRRAQRVKCIRTVPAKKKKFQLILCVAMLWRYSLLFCFLNKQNFFWCLPCPSTRKCFFSATSCCFAVCLLSPTWWPFSVERTTHFHILSLDVILVVLFFPPVEPVSFYILKKTNMIRPVFFGLPLLMNFFPHFTFVHRLSALQLIILSPER